MDKDSALYLIVQNHYYTIDDLRYNQKVGLMLSKDDYAKFLELKDKMVEEHLDLIKKLPLKTFNSKHCFYVEGLYLLTLCKEYMRLLVSDYEIKKSYLFNRNAEDVAISRLFSEIEGTLDIENIPTTRRRIEEVHEKQTPTDENEIIIKNMINAVSYIVNEKPAFNKENLLKLYQLLSASCLSDDKKLKDGEYYRHDKVFIGDFEGADYHILDECMNSLFAFANNPENIKKHTILLPYICHYYVLYIHPYFDYNGRTARMVSFWLNYIYDIAGAPLFMSEAINENKGDYYRAITNTRNTNNDLTYFLGYILETSIKYSFVYKNLEEIKNELSKTGDNLTQTEWGYVKRILVHNSETFFNYKMFLNYIHAKMTKQGALKILDNLTNYNILQKAKNRKGEAIFKFNPDYVTFKYN